MFSKDDKKVARNEVIDMLTVVVTAMGGDRNTRRAFRLITFLMGLLNEDESRQLDLPALFEGIQRQGADMIVWVSVCQVSEDYKGVVLTSLLQLGLKAETDETAIWAYLQLLSSLGSKETITIAFEVLCISRTQLLRNILQKESQIKSLFLSVFSQLQLYISQNIPFGTFIVVETLPDSSFYIPIKEGICIHLKVIGMILTAVSFSLVEEDSMTSLLLSVLEKSSTDQLQQPLLLNSYQALLGAMDTTVLEILASKLPLLFLLKLLVSNVDIVSPPVLLFCLTLLDSSTENIVEVLSPTEAQILLDYTSFHFSELQRTSKFLTLLETLSTKPVEDLVPMELKEEERVATLTSPILPIKWNTVSEILAACESILQSSIEVSIYPYLNIIVQEESIEKRGWLTETVASFISVKNLNLELLKFLLSYDVSLLPNNELHILWKSVLKSDPLPLLQLAIGLSPGT